jgi:uncharacterized protein
VIARPLVLDRIRRALRRSRVVALVGPRQCGKTTLARQIVSVDSPAYFDLESLRGTVVIDEVQRRPDLFPVLRVLADRKPLRARFLVLGRASPDLLRQSSETLAGRLEVVYLSGLSLSEVGDAPLDRHWVRGGFPLSYLSRSARDSFEWRRQFKRERAAELGPSSRLRLYASHA